MAMPTQTGIGSSEIQKAIRIVDILIRYCVQDEMATISHVIVVNAGVASLQAKPSMAVPRLAASKLSSVSRNVQQKLVAAHPASRVGPR